MSVRYFLPLTSLSLVTYVCLATTIARHEFGWLLLSWTLLFLLTYHLLKQHQSFWTLIIVGLIFRSVFFWDLPSLSQDFYRFVWDGRLWAASLNPYLMTPNEWLAENINIEQAQALIDGMGALSARNHSSYPPLYQLQFFLANKWSGHDILLAVNWLRSFNCMADIGTVLLGRHILEAIQLPKENVFWYYLNPLIIVEGTGNVHGEPVMVFLISLSVYLFICKKKPFLSILVLAMGVLTKLIPLIFWPFFIRSFSLLKKIKLTFIFFIILAVGFWPILPNGFEQNILDSVGLWFKHFEFNSGVYKLLNSLGQLAWGASFKNILRFVLPLLTIGLGGWIWIKQKSKNRSFLNALFWIICAYFLLNPTVHPWYLITPLFLGIFTPYRFVLLWSALIVLSYAAYQTNPVEESAWLLTMEYGLVIGLAGWELFVNQKKPNLLNHQ